ncbi:MAG: nicotinate phosphoribosyltransferase [Methylophaga sp.]|nr:nicotinate phosphoribosyltransferase [Methylophaga sp.]
MKINPLTAHDFYKADHAAQYPVGTTEVYSNFTARSAKWANVLPDFDNKIVFFGLQFVIKDYLQDMWVEGFFDKDIDDVLPAYKRRLDNALGKDSVDVSRIAALHQLGYLPLEVKSLPEGSRVPVGVPVLTVVNTHPDFFWLTNFIETALSALLWKPITNATVAYEYRRLMEEYAAATGSSTEGIKFQCHDFSMRGMSGLHDAAMSGAAHLISFAGTDTIPAIDMLELYYNADSDKELVGASVPATEHAVMCMGEELGEKDTYLRLINDVYPEGIVSIVSDTRDFWGVLTELLPEIKSDIMARNGKLVIRPDSGDPVDIICGNRKAKANTPEFYGAIELLWKEFGGTINDAGFKVLDEHIGLIYGDSITLERASEILYKLSHAGFAASNIVFGIGAFTYQFNTRDTFGFAMKATSGVVEGERRNFMKAPKTDIKKTSAKGLIAVRKVHGEYTMFDNQSEEDVLNTELITRFYDGQIINETSLNTIRARLNENF